MREPLNDQDYAAAAAELGCEAKAIKAVASVESAASGFAAAGYPKTLFEGHWFYRLTGGKYAQDYPTICYPTWTRQFYGKTDEQEHDRLVLAMSLDKEAALKSASWGKFQIMGGNFALCGYPDVDSFVADMEIDEAHQLKAFVGFIKSKHLGPVLAAKDWNKFAGTYNGPGQVAVYGARIAAAYARF